jgi:hypothetical protein
MKTTLYPLGNGEWKCSVCKRVYLLIDGDIPCPHGCIKVEDMGSWIPPVEHPEKIEIKVSNKTKILWVIEAVVLFIVACYVKGILFGWPVTSPAIGEFVAIPMMFAVVVICINYDNHRKKKE